MKASDRVSSLYNPYSLGMVPCIVRLLTLLCSDSGYPAPYVSPGPGSPGMSALKPPASSLSSSQSYKPFGAPSIGNHHHVLPQLAYKIQVVVELL